MSLQTITPEMAGGLGLTRDYGVIVSDVWPGGPAEAAGLQPGDILVSVDGQPAENLPTVNYYFRLRDSAEKVQLVVAARHQGAPLSITAGRAEERVRFAGVDGGPGKKPGPRAGDPRHRNRSAHCGRRQRIAGSVRDCRRRARGRREKRRARAAAGT